MSYTRKRPRLPEFAGDGMKYFGGNVAVFMAEMPAGARSLVLRHREGDYYTIIVNSSLSRTRTGRIIRKQLRYIRRHQCSEQN